MLGYLFDVPSLTRGPAKSTQNKTDHFGISLYWVEEKKRVRLSKKVTFKYLRYNKEQKERGKKINEDSVLKSGE